MSAWAAEIDLLSHTQDILFIQSAGNLKRSAEPPSAGILEHLAAGRRYPTYFSQASARVANPAHSLQALTVGSVAYKFYQGANWTSVANDIAKPSSFSRAGFGIWNVIKPDVVEFGGDFLISHGRPLLLSLSQDGRDCYPELVRSTAHGPGPPYDKDEAGTSFAAPKVAHIAARIQQLMPTESCLLYRALIVQSAPDCAASCASSSSRSPCPTGIKTFITSGSDFQQQATSLSRIYAYFAGERTFTSEISVTTGDIHLIRRDGSSVSVDTNWDQQDSNSAWLHGSIQDGGLSRAGGTDVTYGTGSNRETTFTSNYSTPASPTELEQAIGSAAANAIHFARPGSVSQLWDMQLVGSLVGEAKVTVAYDPSLLGGADPSSLFIQHYTGGFWVAPDNQVVDPLAHTISFTTSSFSPFLLATSVPEPSSCLLLGLGVLSLAMRRRRL